MVQVHPGSPFKSSVNTRRFSLFPFPGISPKNRFVNRLSTSRLAGCHCTQGVARQRNSRNHAARARSSEITRPAEPFMNFNREETRNEAAGSCAYCPRHACVSRPGSFRRHAENSLVAISDLSKPRSRPWIIWDAPVVTRTYPLRFTLRPAVDQSLGS